MRTTSTHLRAPPVPLEAADAVGLHLSCRSEAAVPHSGMVTTKSRYMRADELFPTVGPVPQDMIGRRQESDLRLRLDQGMHQIVAGPRRQGKTTVCLAATDQLRRRGKYVVGADLFAIPTLERFAEVLIAEVWANRSSSRRAARALGKGSRAAAAALGAAATVRLRTELGDGVELAFDPSRSTASPN